MSGQMQIEILVELGGVRNRIIKLRLHHRCICARREGVYRDSKKGKPKAAYPVLFKYINNIGEVPRKAVPLFSCYLLSSTSIYIFKKMLELWSAKLWELKISLTSGAFWTSSPVFL